VTQFQVRALLDGAAAGRRLSAEEALFLYEQGTLLELGQAADRIRRQRWPGNVATFVVDRNINYANACEADCSFCAFYRKPGHPEAYRLPIEEGVRRVGELIEQGGTQVLFQGGLDTTIPFSYYEELCRAVKAAHPGAHLHSFSAPEIETMSKATGMGYEEILIRLRAAGLDSVPGGGAEILVDRVRDAVSPKKTTAQTWIAVHRAIHAVGMRSTATMTYGLGETAAERIEHLIKIRQLQDERGGFTAFIPWSFQRGHTVLTLPPPGGMEYLRVIAISRLVLDNVPSIQAGWVTEGPKLAQVALSFGANDFGGILIDEVVVGATGVVYRVDRAEALRLIRGAGRLPAQRNTKYEILKVYEQADDNAACRDLRADPAPA